MALVAMCRSAHMLNSMDESKRLNEMSGLAIILSASGMVFWWQHSTPFKSFFTLTPSTPLFAGFEAVGTHGAAMLEGMDSIKIHVEYVPVRASRVYF